MQGVDALIVDSAYTRDEYPARQGWGHGTLDSALAIRVGAKALYLTHHEPTRGGDELEAAFADLLARQPPPAALKVVLAYEGLEVELGERAATVRRFGAICGSISQQRSSSNKGTH